MKKLVKFSLLFSLILIICAGICSVVSANSINKYTCGDYVYTVLNDGTACIEEYIGAGTKIVIPEKVDDYTVTCIGSYLLVDEPQLDIKADENSTVTSIIIPETVTKIKSGAFYNCKALVDINIPDNVQVIYESTFAGCESLVDLDLPDNLKNINAGAFARCKALKSVNIPDTVTYIGAGAFQICDSLVSIDIPDSVTYIGRYAFYNSKNLIDINMPSAVTQIGIYAFNDTGYYNDLNNWTNGILYLDNCLITSDISITGNHIIPEGTIIIADNAFTNRVDLNGISIPGSVKVIGENAFNNCSSLSELTISEGVTEINEAAFENCESLCELILPDSVNELGKSMFSGCSSLKSIKLPEGIEVIEERTFEGCTSLDNVVLPDSVTVIGYSAFYGCRSLTNIVLSANLSEISDHAFMLCRNLKEITMPDSLKYIGNNAFSFCEGLTSVNLNSGLEGIDSWAFERCTSLTEVNIPYGLLNIGSYVFSKCESLKTIEIPDSVTDIKWETFSECYNLESVKLSANMTNIPKKLFYNCSKLESVIIPEGIENIDEYAFYGCGLRSLYLPDTVTEIGQYAFCDCRLMSEVYLSKNLITVDNNAFDNCDSIKEIEIPASLETIPENFMPNCVNLKTVIISDGVRLINDSAFNNCISLSNVTIPESVSYISYTAFTKVNTNNKSITISGYYGSRAESYAEANNFEFIYLDDELPAPSETPEVTEMPTNTPEPPMALELIGDINEDSFINAEDALLVLKYSAKLMDLSDINGFLLRGDVDKSGVLDASDALKILKYAAGLIDSFDEVVNTETPTEIPEDYHIIYEGQTKDVTISTAKEKATFEFTPTESGYYRYHSSGEMSAEFGTINDSEGDLLVERRDYAYIEYGRYPVFFDEFSFDFYFEAGKTYYLNAFLEGNSTGEFSVYLVKLTEPEKVIINGQYCPYGTERELSVSYEPEYSLGFIASWTSSNPEIVTVDNQGKIKGVGIGKANVTVTTTKGLTYTAEIEVNDYSEINVGDVISHWGVFESIDYYKFVPDKDGEYIIKSNRLSGGNSYSNVYINVYDSGFTNKLYSASGIDYELKCEFKAGEAYYIKIESNAGDYGLMQNIEIADIDEVLELSAGDTIQLPDLESSSGSPYTWSYEVAEEDEGLSVGLVTDDSGALIPGDGVKTICTLTAEEPGVYYVHFTLSNESWSYDIEVIERITYKVIVK